MAKRSQKRKSEEIKQQTKKQIAMGRREARQNRTIMFSVVAVVAVVVLVLAVGLVQELLIKPNQPVATVNGTKIAADFYQDAVNFQRYSMYDYLAQAQDQLSSFQTSPEENDFLIQYLQQQISQLQQQLTLIPETALDDLIDAELIREKAEEVGITVTDEDVEAELRRRVTPTQETITETQTLPTPTPIPQETVDDYYRTLVDNMHITKRSYEEMTRLDLLRQELQKFLAAQVPTTGLVAHAQIIQTETEDEALAAQQRVEGGEDFALVAQEVSTDTLSVADGGDLGWVATGQLVSRYGQEVEDAVFGQAVEELTVVESGGMFYLIQVLERDENGPLPEAVLLAQQNSALVDWLQERKASPDVEIERLLSPSQIPDDPFIQQQVIPG